jgi:hypothetical protein
MYHLSETRLDFTTRGDLSGATLRHLGIVLFWWCTASVAIVVDGDDASSTYNKYGRSL